MNKEIFFDTFRDIAPEYIASAAPREGRRTARAGHWKIAAIAAAVALLAVGVIAIMPFLIKIGDEQPPVVPESWSETDEREEVYYYLDDLKNYEMQGMPSRGSLIRTLPSDAVAEHLPEASVKAMFGADELPFPLYYSDENQYTTNIYYSPQGEVYCVHLSFMTDGGERIDVCIDPENIPNFKLLPTEDTLLSENNSTVIKGYTVGMMTYLMGDFDICMNKGTTGIWIKGSKDDEKQDVEKVLNFILNSEIDFEVVKGSLQKEGRIKGYYYLDDLKNYEFRGFVCRGSLIRTLPSDAVAEHLPEASVKAMFGADELPFPLYYSDENQYTTNIYYSPQGEVYCVHLSFMTDVGERIDVCIDPENIPNFKLLPTDDTLLSENSSTVIKGYTVGMMTYLMGDFDICMKNGSIGIWIKGSKDDEKQDVEKVLNFILNSEIDFEVVKK